LPNNNFSAEEILDLLTIRIFRKGRPKNSSTAIKKTNVYIQYFTPTYANLTKINYDLKNNRLNYDIEKNQINQDRPENLVIWQKSFQGKKILKEDDTFFSKFLEPLNWNTQLSLTKSTNQLHRKIIIKNASFILNYPVLKNDPWEWTLTIQDFAPIILKFFESSERYNILINILTQYLNKTKEVSQQKQGNLNLVRIRRRNKDRFKRHIKSQIQIYYTQYNRSKYKKLRSLRQHKCDSKNKKYRMTTYSKIM